MSNSGGSKTLIKKLCEVVEAISSVPKRGRNTFHNYDYVMESDLLEAVRHELATRDIFMSTSIDTIDQKELQAKDGAVKILTTIQTTFTFHDGANGQTFSVKGGGAGEDKGDKGIYKAITGAVKYAISKNFLIPTGDDPESDEATDKRNFGGRPSVKNKPTTVNPNPPAADKVLERFFKLCDKLGPDAYLGFMQAPGKTPPDLETIAGWSKPNEIKYLDKICSEMEASGSSQEDDL